MVNRVLVLMSVYNGGSNIKRQIESILIQKDVHTVVYIRDDGSNFETKKELDEMIASHPGRIILEYGINIGWKRSFIELVFSADLDYDYYAFSDQDDIWFESKLINCIRKMEQDKYNGCKLAHCNCLSVDQGLSLRKEQEKRQPKPPSFKMAIATEYFQGCGMVWNNKAMNFLRQYKPKNTDLAHDYWVGLICYLFGRVYFVEEPQFYHIRYQNNSSEDGQVLKGRLSRLKRILSGDKGYMNPANDILCGYSYSIQNKELLEFLKKITNYKKLKKNKISLIFDLSFRRPTIIASALFKLCLLIERY